MGKNNSSYRITECYQQTGKSLSQWARELGISREAARLRWRKYGDCGDEALLYPERSNKFNSHSLYHKRSENENN